MALDLEQFLRSSWGRCPAFNADMGLNISRVCPLARQVYALRREQDDVPPSFLCGSYRKDCPVEDQVIDAALLEEEAGTRRRFHGEDVEPVLSVMYGSGQSVKAVNALVDVVLDAYFEQRGHGTVPDTSGWSPQQMELHRLLWVRRERSRR